MSTHTDLRALLLADPVIASLIGTRISADRVEQAFVRPFVVYRRAARVREKTLNGTVVSDLHTFDVQVWADTRASCQAVAEAIQRVIEAANHDASNSEDISDPDLGLQAESITVEWWADV